MSDGLEFEQQAPGGKPGKPEIGDNPGRGGGRGRERMGVCQLQERGVKYKILPAHAALKMINAGKATAAPNGPVDCESLSAALIFDEDEE